MLRPFRAVTIAAMGKVGHDIGAVIRSTVEPDRGGLHATATQVTAGTIPF